MIVLLEARRKRKESVPAVQKLNLNSCTNEKWQRARKKVSEQTLVVK
jgi:hypothetical protein